MLRSLLIVLLIATSLTACGNKGPLVLPDPTPAPTPQQDKDKKPASTIQPAPASGSATTQH